MRSLPKKVRTNSTRKIQMKTIKKTIKKTVKKTTKKTIKRSPLKNTGDNEIYDITISSHDEYLLFKAYRNLPRSQQKYNLGSGLCFFTGESDHHFRCKGYERMLKIVKHYKSILPCKIYDYSEAVREDDRIEAEEKAKAKAKKCPRTKKS